jgi:hypothetical protein
MKSNKTLAIVAAAFGGLVAGSAFTASASTLIPTGNSQVSAGQHRTLSQTAGQKAVRLDDDKNDCKGKNSCKGKGGCKTGDNGCKGKNSCKGNGGCKTADATSQPSQLLSGKTVR